jgi:ankyrin repeat protein
MGWTALMAAAFNGQEAVVEYLLSLPEIDIHCREYVSP